MTVIAFDRKQRYTIRKIAAVVAGLLVFGIAAATSVAAWNDSADRASSSSQVGVVFSALSGASG